MTTPNFPNTGFIQILRGGATPPNTPLPYAALVLTHNRRETVSTLLNKYTMPDFISLETLSLKGKKEEMRVEKRKTNRMLRCG